MCLQVLHSKGKHQEIRQLNIQGTVEAFGRVLLSVTTQDSPQVTELLWDFWLSLEAFYSARYHKLSPNYIPAVFLGATNGVSSP